MTRSLEVGTFGGASALPVRVAAVQGLFRQHGLDVRASVTKASGQLRDGLRAGDIAIAHLAPDNVIAWVDDGASVRAWLAGSAGPISLVARDVETVEGLRGLRIGVDAAGSGFAPILRQLLASAGLGEDEVELVPTGATRLRFAALEEGSIAASMLTLPWSLLASRFGSVQLADHTAVAAGLVTSCAASSTSWLAGQPTLASAYADAIDAAVAWLHDERNRTAASELLAEDMGIEASVASGVLDVMLDAKGGWPRQARLRGGELEATWQLRSSTLGQPGLAAGGYIALLPPSGQDPGRT